jgi:hypothetical protein
MKINNTVTYLDTIYLYYESKARKQANNGASKKVEETGMETNLDAGA